MSKSSEMYGLSNDNTYFDNDITQSFNCNKINSLRNTIMNDFNIKLQETNSNDNLTTGRSVVNDTMTFRTLKSKYLLRHINKCAVISYEFFKVNDTCSIYIPSAWDKVNKIKLSLPDLYRILKRLLFYFEIKHESKKNFSKDEFIDIANQYYDCMFTIDNGYFSTLILPNNPLIEYFHRNNEFSSHDNIKMPKNKENSSQLYEKCNIPYVSEFVNRDKIQAFIVHKIKDNFTKITDNTDNKHKEFDILNIKRNNADKYDVDKWSLKNNRNSNVNNSYVTDKQSTLKRIFSSVKPKGSARSNIDSANDKCY